MKKVLTSLLSFLVTVMAFAQEKSIEIKINGENADGEYLAKATLLIIFTLVILILVIRTFRGKSSA